jgi:hypothetical protein
LTDLEGAAMKTSATPSVFPVSPEIGSPVRLAASGCGDAKALLRTDCGGVEFGQESWMLGNAKYFAVATASLLLMVFLPNPVHAQDLSTPRILNTSASLDKTEQEAAPCTMEAEMALVPHLLMIAEGACDVHDPGKMGTGFCLVAEQGKPDCNADEERAQFQFAAMGKRGETISRARTRVLEILQGENACTAWFRELELDPGGVFRSVRFVVDEKGPQYILGMKQGGRGELLKHPWVASTVENAGRGATIWVNANGAFFNRTSELIERAQGGGPVKPAGTRVLRVEMYSGNTPEAQITALLHELGHILGRIPEDSDSLDGESGRNTAEILRFCRPEIKAVAEKSHREGR